MDKITDFFKEFKDRISHTFISSFIAIAASKELTTALSRLILSKTYWIKE